MKCPNCNAELSGGKFCEYCGAQLTLDMKKEQEALNKAGCPKCGSSNITFSREKQGEYLGKNGKTVVRVTVGLCKDCGYTWNTSGNTGGTAGKPKNNMLWWVLGWIFFFPAPVMILVWRQKNTWPTKTKLIVTIVFWVLLLGMGLLSDEDTTSKTMEDNHLYENAEDKDVMNGFRVDKIGEYSICYEDRADCTEEALSDWDYNYIIKNKFNWCMLLYKDKNENTGAYAMKNFVWKG